MEYECDSDSDVGQLVKQQPHDVAPLCISSGLLAMTVSVYGGSSHHHVLNVQATVAELKRSLAKLAKLPAQELILVRDGPCDAEDLVARDSFRYSDWAQWSEQPQGLSTDDPREDMEYSLCSNFDVLRVLPGGADAQCSPDEGFRHGLWELDRAQEVVASVTIRRAPPAGALET